MSAAGQGEPPAAELRTARPEEFPELCRAVGSGFGEVPDERTIERWLPATELDRAWAALDGGRIVGGATASSMRISVPGGEVPMCGITSLGVSPSHRRRGIGAALLARCLEQARERGEPVAGLWASESRIYRRFGFGVATRACRFELDTAHAAFARPAPAGGSVRLLGEDEAFEAFAPLYEALRASQPGMPARPGVVWPLRFHEDEGPGDPPLVYALHEGGAGPDGYAAYRVRPDWGEGIARHVVEVEELLATTPEGWAGIWRFVLDLDLVETVRAWLRPPDDPLSWLLADPRRAGVRVRDGLWLRPVDVRAALAGRRYGVEGEVVFDVRDPALPSNEGRVRLEGGPEGAACAPTGAGPDLVLGAEHLAAAFLGDASFGAMVRVGEIEEGRSGAAARADRMFLHRPAPWCPGEF
ncbi:MAG TPA: GNAT family N-acetyltransferase [Actinomycetota bacterium]|nr:GNAT family N-acetyltransferase [Actinomycetota bacterium]